MTRAAKEWRQQAVESRGPLGPGQATLHGPGL